MTEEENTNSPSTSSQIISESRKRNTAYKLRIGDILKSRPIIQEGRLLHLELGDKKIVRVNLIANVVDKFVNQSEKKYVSITLDDASGQIRLKAFGDDAVLLERFSQGDTLQVVGVVREYNSELYLLPEIAKVVDPKWLLVRKLEIQGARKDLPATSNNSLKEIIMDKIKLAEKDQGVDIDALIMEIEAAPNLINQEITKLLEEGLIYEPRPGRLRYLG